MDILALVISDYVF